MMTPEQQQKVIDKLIAVGVKNVCSECGHNEFEIQAIPIALPTLTGSNLNLGQGYPVIARMCKQCAATVLHAAQYLGFGPTGLS